MINSTDLILNLDKIRRESPLIHNITNYVVMNNTANALLAIGASPVMAHAKEEVEEMAGIARAVVLNIGTLEPAWVDAMIIAGKTAKKQNTPLIFDPVGAGATSYRNKVCRQIILDCQPDIIRGNASEIMALSNTSSRTKGVDSSDSSDTALKSAISLAKEINCVVVISGETDYITDGERTEKVIYGNPMMARVTGMGCTATAIVGAFAAVSGSTFEGAFHGMMTMGIAGERAVRKSHGNGSLQVNFLDELYRLNGQEILQHLQISAV